MKKTVYIVIGPHNSGKTTIRQALTNRLREEKHIVVEIDTKDMRKQVAGGLIDAGILHSMSDKAYDMTFAYLESLMKFPSFVDSIVMESSGLSDSFRSEVLRLAGENGYLVELIALDVGESKIRRNCEERGIDSYDSVRQHKKFRRETLASLNRKLYKKTYTLRSVEDQDTIEIESRASASSIYIRCADDAKVAVVGDVHECIEEFAEMESKLRTIGVTHMVISGDMFDKGNRTKEMIEYIEKKLQAGVDDVGSAMHVTMVRGNHERYIKNALTGQIQVRDLDMEAEYFTSLKAIESDPDLVKRFLEIERLMVDSVCVVRAGELPIYVTHAPCYNMFIGNGSKDGIRAMNNFRYTAPRGDLNGQLQDLNFIMREANNNHPWHVFGHVAHVSDKPFRVKNKIFLDTGCVHGHKLSAVVFYKWHVDYVMVDSKQEKHLDDLLPSFYGQKKSILERLDTFTVNLDEVEERQMRRIIRGGAKFISGTMAPSPADVLNLDIESLDKAIREFTSVGVTDLFIEPKYMGSRAQAYLFKDRSKNFAVSRNGFRISIPGIEVALNAVQDAITENVEFEDSIILDCELLPWSSLGSGLIHTEFVQYSNTVDAFLQNLETDEVFKGFDLANTLDLSSKRDCLEKFNEQLNIYAGDVLNDMPVELKFMPFDILAIDGRVDEVKNNELNFRLVGDSMSQSMAIRIDANNPDDIIRLKNLVNSMTTVLKYEGIVIKPTEYTSDMQCAPYMKVRNKEYLRLIYGYDYTDRLADHCEQKGIRMKTRLSIDEYEIGQAMLKNTDPVIHEKLVAAMMGCLSREKGLDPRL